MLTLKQFTKMDKTTRYTIIDKYFVSQYNDYINCKGDNSVSLHEFITAHYKSLLQEFTDLLENGGIVYE